MSRNQGRISLCTCSLGGQGPFGWFSCAWLKTSPCCCLCPVTVVIPLQNRRPSVYLPTREYPSEQSKCPAEVVRGLITCYISNIPNLGYT